VSKSNLFVHYFYFYFSTFTKQKEGYFQFVELKPIYQVGDYPPPFPVALQKMQKEVLSL